MEEHTQSSYDELLFPFPSTCSHPEGTFSCIIPHQLPIAQTSDTHKKKRHASGRSVAFIIAYYAQSK